MGRYFIFFEHLVDTDSWGDFLLLLSSLLISKGGEIFHFFFFIIFFSIRPRTAGAELCLMTKWAILDEDGDDVDGGDDGDGSHDGTEDHGDDDDIV